MKKLKEMGMMLSKKEQKSVNGGKRDRRCRFGDQVCCGTANWQCGAGPSAGGYFNPSNGTCDCA